MMRAYQVIALAACVASAEVAVAQIPRDPTADSRVTAQPAATADTQQLPAPFVTKQSEVEIPFSVRSGATPETQPASVRIFVSWDRGKTWHFYDERRPTDARFRFRPRQDGEFWFATQTMDRSGRPDSAEPRKPQLRLVIDTQRPQLLVQSNVDGSGNVNLSWSAADANLTPTSLKLEYQDAAGNGGPWLPIEPRSAAASPTATLTGQTVFRANVSSRAINVRAEVADAAGNVAYYSQRMSLVPPKSKTDGGLAYAPAADPSATRWPTTNPHLDAEAAGQLAANTEAKSTAENEDVKIPNLMGNPFTGPGRLASAKPALDMLPPPVITNTQPPADSWRPSQLSAQPGVSPERLPQPGESGSPGSASAHMSPVVDATPAVPASPSFESLPAQRQYGATAPSVTPLPDLTPQPRATENLPRSQAIESIDPPTARRPRLTNSRRFSLDYDVETVGPEGLSAVELWGTTDGGRTWVKWGVDPDKTSPFDVEVNHEAIYGFRIVIVGKNGLATTTPQPGEAADIWVGVDLTRPTAKLTGAAYGQGEAAGKLDIRWHAEDANLGSRPITLAIGDRPDGPFTAIAAGLPNTGQYFWEYDPRSPRQIFLRLEARDDAGNIAIDQLTEPIKVEGLEPKGHIRGFNSGPEGNRGAFRSPLFR